MDRRIYILASIFIFKVVPSNTTSTFEVQMVKFSNPTGQKYMDGCCEILCLSECDNKFLFCLDVNRNPKNSDYNTCFYDKHQTGEFPNKNNIDFEGDMAGVANPIQITLSGGESKVVLKVNILDDDNDGDQQVDSMYRELSFTLARSIDSANWISTDIRGTRSRNPTMLSVKYRSYCNTGYYGTACGIYCMATDSIQSGHYTCDPATGNKICLRGWVNPGSLCKTKDDPCTELTCENDGICLGGGGTYSCSCSVGYTGQHCESRFNPCDSMPCISGGTCSTSGNTFSCSCLPNFGGTRCEVEVDYCLSQPCMHNGTCHQLSVEQGYTCNCSTPYTGSRCESCYSSLCNNGGTCTVDIMGQALCLCSSSYTGPQCDVEMDACSSAPCRNGGTCLLGQSGGTFVCSCPEQYTGTQCDVELDACSSAPCRNGGTCSLERINETFVCSCPSQYTGPQCDVELNVCSSAPCSNGGVCKLDPRGGTFICSCPEQYTGPQCDVELDVCSSAPCRNGGTCLLNPSDQTFVCLCSERYTAGVCESFIPGPEKSCSEPDSCSGGTNWTWIGLGIGGGSLILIIIIISVVCVKKRQRDERKKNDNVTNHERASPNAYVNEPTERNRNPLPPSGNPVNLNVINNSRKPGIGEYIETSKNPENQYNEVDETRMDKRYDKEMLTKMDQESNQDYKTRDKTGIVEYLQMAHEGESSIYSKLDETRINKNPNIERRENEATSPEEPYLEPVKNKNEPPLTDEVANRDRLNKHIDLDETEMNLKNKLM